MRFARGQWFPVRSLLTLLLLTPTAAWAQAAASKPPGMAAQMAKWLRTTANFAGFIPDDPKKPRGFVEIIGIYFQGILGFLGLIFLILIIWDGIKWMTAGGNEDQITKAKTGIKNRAIGLTIILLARLITAVFLDLVAPAVGG